MGQASVRGYSVSPLQRRKGLATFKVEVASSSGAVAFRLADAEAALAVNLIERLGPGIPAG